MNELELSTRPRLVVFNKVDRLKPEEVETLLHTSRRIGEVDPLAVSAKDPSTLRPLFLAMERALWKDDLLKDRASFEGEADAPTEERAPEAAEAAPGESVPSVDDIDSLLN